MRVQVPELVRLEERSSVPGLALASVERSAIDVPRRSLGVEYLDCRVGETEDGSRALGLDPGGGAVAGVESRA